MTTCERCEQCGAPMDEPDDLGDCVCEKCREVNEKELLAEQWYNDPRRR